MRRQLNVRLLILTLVAVSVTALAVFLLHRFQVQRNAGILLSEAERAIAKKQLRLAATHLQHYLTYVPEDTRALALYGQTLGKIGNSPAVRYQAFLLLEQALRRDPQRHELRREAVQLAQDLYRFSDAARHLTVLLQQTPKDAELWYRLGRCQEAEGNYSRAEESYRKALALDARHLATYERLTNLLLFQLERPAQVIKLLDEMVAANKDSYQAYLGRARYLNNSGERSRAWEDVRQAARLAPDKPEVILTVAELEFLGGAPDKARAELERGLKVNPGNVPLLRTLAWVELKQNHRDRALEVLREGLKQVPDSADLQVALADLVVENGPSPEVTELLHKLQKQSIEPGILECLQSRLLLQQGQVLPALDLLHQAAAQLRSPAWQAQVAYLQGQCQELLGDLQEAIVSYRRAVNRNPSWTGARQALAGVLLASGRSNEALLELRPIREATDATSAVELLQARAQIVQFSRLPDNQRDWSAVEDSLTRAERKKAPPLELALVRAEMAALRGQWEQAAETLQQARQQQPREVRLWLALADLARRRQRPDEARQILEETAAKCGDSLELRLAWVRYWSRGNFTAQTAQQGLLEQERQLKSMSAEQQVRLLRELAAALHRLGDLPGAERLWREVSQRLPRDISSRQLLFEVALHSGKESEARRWVDELKQIEGDRGGVWRYAEAALLVAQASGRDQRRLAAAEKLLKGLTEQQREWGRPYLLLGNIAEWMGRPEEAIQHYQRALLLGEVQPASVTRLVRFLMARGQHFEAEQALRKVEQLMPLDRELARLGAEAALRNNDKGRALKLARQVAPPDARDYRDQLWLANLLTSADQSKEAEQVLRQAVKKSGSVPEVWVALVRHLGQSGQASQVPALLEEMSRQVPAHAVPATRARCAEVLGQLTEAEKLFRAAWAGTVDDFQGLKNLAEFYLRTGRFDQAEPLLRQLIAPETRLPGELVARARRQLARGLAGRGDPARLAEALKLLDANKKQGRDFEDDLARAVVLAQPGASPAQRKQAVQLFQRLEQEQPLPLEDQYTLARLYEQAGDAGRAADTLLRLVTAAPGQPDYLAGYIRLLLLRKNVVDAGYYLKRLEQLEPQTERTRQLRQELERTKRKLAEQAP